MRKLPNSLYLGHASYVCSTVTSLLNKSSGHLTTRESRIITPSMAKKILAAGLRYCYLDLVYKRDGPDGLVAILKEEETYHKIALIRSHQTIYWTVVPIGKGN